MSLDALYMIVEGAIGASVIIFVTLMSLRIRAVPGTHKKYVATSLLVVVIGFQSLLFMTMAVIRLLLDQQVSAGIDFVCSAIWAWWCWRLLHDSDNWFNNQYKKLKRGLKNLRSRLQFIPSPAPAFG
jgi:hypothetical protein